MNSVIAKNLKEIRRSMNISLSELAERTYVSKSMIGQIERGESSPTISTLCKISSGLNIPFENLLRTEDEVVTVIKEAEVEPKLSNHGHCRMFPLIPVRYDRTFEMYDIILDPGASSETAVHENGTKEFLYVYEGQLTMSVGTPEEEYKIGECTMISFPADRWHEYRNDSERIARAVLIIQYNRG